MTYITFQNSRVVAITEADNQVHYCARVDTERGVIRYEALAYYHGNDVYAVLHSAHNEDLPDKDFTQLDYFRSSEAALDFALEFVSRSKVMTNG
jgi:hypothetical protein